MGRRSEQLLFEDLIIEALKIYGFDLYYIPRESVNQDNIFNEDVLQKYTNALPIEMYLENVDGWGGEGELLTKFGLEIRNTATLVVSRRRWDEIVGQSGTTVLPNRPAEGDVIYFPLTKSYLEIKKVDATDPFFQVGKLHVYKLQCELMQYSSEEFATPVDEINNLIEGLSEKLTDNQLTLETGDIMLLEYETPSSIVLEGFKVTTEDLNADNELFDSGIRDILDFSERNPFGEIFK